MTALPVIHHSGDVYEPKNMNPVQLLIETAKEYGCRVHCDNTGNILVLREADAGRESAQTVLLQGNTDAACQFMTRLIRRNDRHLPPLELLLTKRNETSFYGAREFDMSLLHATTMINLDGFHEQKVICSAAGSLQMTFETHVTRVVQPKNYIPVEIVVSGYTGGENGSDMTRKGGNPIKIASEFLFRWYNFSIDTRLVGIHAGQWINHIPCDCHIRLYIEETKRRNMDEACWWYGGELSRIFAATDPNAQIRAYYPTVDTADPLWKPMDADDTGRILSFLNLSPNGIVSQNDQIQNLIETSSNMGICRTTYDSWSMGIQIRSADDSKKRRLREKLSQMAEMNRIYYSGSHNSSSWLNAEESPVRELILSTYEQMFGEKLVPVETHNSTECAIFVEALDRPDTIGIGFNREADGTVCPLSMERMLRVVTTVLEQI